MAIGGFQQFGDIPQHLNKAIQQIKDWLFGGLSDIQVGSAGLRDAGTNYYLQLKSDSTTAFTANRILTLDLDNAARTLKITGNPTIADWFDQAVKIASSPTFVALTLSQTTGTAPMTIASTTVVTNLNADKADGYDFNQSVQTTDDVTFADVAATTIKATGAEKLMFYTYTQNLSAADIANGYTSITITQVDETKIRGVMSVAHATADVIYWGGYNDNNYGTNGYVTGTTCRVYFDNGNLVEDDDVSVTIIVAE